MLQTNLDVARVWVGEFLEKDIKRITPALLDRELSSISEEPFVPMEIPGTYFAYGTVTGPGFATKFKETNTDIMLWQATFEATYFDKEHKLYVPMAWSHYIMEMQGPNASRFYEDSELKSLFERIDRRYRSLAGRYFND